MLSRHAIALAGSIFGRSAHRATVVPCLSLPSPAPLLLLLAESQALGTSTRTHADSRTCSTQRQFAAQTSKHYDAVVVGLGAYGSAVLYHLAKAGLKVLGIERQQTVGHSFGSSHGASRIIRLAYMEGLQYGPLLRRSYRLFLELQDELARVQGRPLSEPLFLRTGMLDIGATFEKALESARAYGLQHEVLTGSELNQRFPAYRVPERWRALYQPDGGVLAPERIVQAHIILAQRLGAHVLTGASVADWRVAAGGEGGGSSSHGNSGSSSNSHSHTTTTPDSPAVTLTLRPTAAATASPTCTVTATASVTAGQGGAPGEGPTAAGPEAEGVPEEAEVLRDEVQVTATTAVFTPGPWIGHLVPELQDLCVPERQVVGWFKIEAASRRHFAPDRLPVFLIDEGPPLQQQHEGPPLRRQGGTAGQSQRHAATTQQQHEGQTHQGGAAYYGFPEHGPLPGFKIGLYRHLRQEIRDPADLDAAVRRTADAADEAALRTGLAAYFPAAARGRLLAASVCFFNNTPDGHFLVDRHPRHKQVILCSACSGHGFKMSSGIGQLIARMVVQSGAAGGGGGGGSGATGQAAASAAARSAEPAGVAGAVATVGDDDSGNGGWEELLPFRFDPVARPGNREVLERFGLKG